jgi:adenosylcobinamide kinase/adenosylcobinamide-phosphate guanylyltransferase
MAKQPLQSSGDLAPNPVHAKGEGMPSPAARLALVTGGCRSGKSAYAQQWAESLPLPRLYIATCPVTDDEMRYRIEMHRHARCDRGWETIEEQTDLAGVLGRHVEPSAILVDCVTLWVNNLMYFAQREGREFGEAEMVERCRHVLDACRKVHGTVIFVTNEVGLGIVPATPEGRRYRDLIGRANQTIAAQADAVILVSCGIPLPLKSP